MGSHSLLQGIFPTQGSSPGLLHYRQILCHLSHQRSPHATKKTQRSPPKKYCVTSRQNAPPPLPSLPAHPHYLSPRACLLRTLRVDGVIQSMVFSESGSFHWAECFPGSSSLCEGFIPFRGGQAHHMGFPGGSDGKESACNAEDPGSIPGLGRSLGEGNGNPLQYSC